MDDNTQPRKAETVVELGNEKSQPPEVLSDDANGQPRKSETPEADKTSRLGHEEEFFAADDNLFGNGRTHLTMEKPGWTDPK